VSPSGLIYRFVTLLALIILAPSSWAEEPGDTLALARELSFSEDWQQARPMLDEIEPFISPDQVREYGEFQLLRARHETLAGDSEAAIRRMEQLLELALPDDQRSQALHSIAHASVLLRDYERAFDALDRALALDPDEIDNANRIPILNMGAYMFGRVGETDRALRHGRRAIELARADSDLRAECISRQRVAPVLKWAERKDEAEQAYRLGIEQCGRIGNDLFVGVLQHGLADLLRNRGRTQEAFDLATQAIEVLDEGVFPLGEYEARLVHAEALFELEPDAIATAPWPQRFAELESFMREHQSWDQLARLEALRSRIALHRDEPTRAVTHLERQLEARERFLGLERQIRLAYAEVQFDTRLKEQEIALLHERARAAEIATQATRQQQQLRNLVLLLAGLLVVLLALGLQRMWRARRHFQHLSRHDGLTGLANHSWFFEHAETRIVEARKTGRQQFLVLIDIDHFKAINDTHGHQAGDRVLHQLANSLRTIFGAEALIGRLGGEEFGILTEAASPRPIFKAVERLQAQLKNDPASVAEPQISLSLGLTRITDDDTPTDAFRRADELLYRAKAAGRDQLVADPSLENHDQKPSGREIPGVISTLTFGRRE